MFIAHLLYVRHSINCFKYILLQLYNNPVSCYHFHLKLRTLIFEKEKYLV